MEKTDEVNFVLECKMISDPDIKKQKGRNNHVNKK